MLAAGHATPALAVRPIARMHATLLRSEPAKDGKLTASPSRIYLVFSEEVEPSLGGIRLVGPAGQIVALKPAGDPRNVSALVAPVTTTLAGGTWRVEWRIVSEDGHPIDGDFTFSIAGAPGDSVTAAATPPSTGAAMPDHEAIGHPMAMGGDSTSARERSPLEKVPLLAAMLRGVGIGLLTAFAGLLWFLETRRDGARQPRAERLALWLALAMGLPLALHFVVWAIAVSPGGSITAEHMSAMAASRVGRTEMVRDVLALLAGWAMLLAKRPRLALAFAIGSLLVSSATGHSAAIHSLWTIPMRGMHLFAIAAWLGGLLWLVTLERSSVAVMSAEAERVSSLALVAVIVVTITGVIQTKFFIGEWGELVRSSYGFVTLVKLAGLTGLVLFGAHHRFRVMPRLAESGVADDFSRSLRREVVLLSVVILVGGLLSYVPPPQH